MKNKKSKKKNKEKEEEVIGKLCNIKGFRSFVKEDAKSKIWDVIPEEEEYGGMYISFDCKKIYNLYKDYPDNMTEEEIEIFEKENPLWKELFK